jgi:hypothetical protein
MFCGAAPPFPPPNIIPSTEQYPPKHLQNRPSSKASRIRDPVTAVASSQKIPAFTFDKILGSIYLLAKIRCPSLGAPLRVRGGILDQTPWQTG